MAHHAEGRGDPVADYFEAQGRYGRLDPQDVAAIQAEVDRGWARLVARESATT